MTSFAQFGPPTTPEPAQAQRAREIAAAHPPIYIFFSTDFLQIISFPGGCTDPDDLSKSR